MATAKRLAPQHLIDQRGQQLLREKLPSNWLLREYRPDYGLDFTIELFGTTRSANVGAAGHETLGEHIFVQLKSAESPKLDSLALFSRGNVEKAPERPCKGDKVGEVSTYRFQLEMPGLITVERMGIGVPVLLVIADLSARCCSFVCLNDYIDKILIPRHEDDRAAASRTVHVPARNEIGSELGQIAMRWYAKRPKLTAAFQRFTYQYAELQQADDRDWRTLANYFAERISSYDFWDDTEMCGLIPFLGAGLQRFRKTGQPGIVKMPAKATEVVADAAPSEHDEKRDVFELWRQPSQLPKTNEDLWREWFLPTPLGELTSSPPPTEADSSESFRAV